MNVEIVGNSEDGFVVNLRHDSSDAELKPCPFCESRRIEIVNTHTPAYWAECEDCGAKKDGLSFSVRSDKRSRVLAAHEKSFWSAIEQWNRRVAGAA
jgi:hypothetical protein